MGFETLLMSLHFLWGPIILTLSRQPWWQPFWLPRVPQGGCLVVFSGSLKLPASGGLPGWYTFYIFFVWDLAILQLKEFWAHWLTGPSWHWWGSTSVRFFTSSRDQNHLLWAGSGFIQKRTSFSQIHSSLIYIYIILLLWYGKQILMFTRFAKFLVKYGDFKHCTTRMLCSPTWPWGSGATWLLMVNLSFPGLKIEDLKKEKKLKKFWSWPSFQFIGMLAVQKMFSAFNTSGFSRRLKDFLSTSVDMRTTSEGLYHKIQAHVLNVQSEFA